MNSARPRFRKREILAAVLAGGLAAGGAALVLDANEARPEARAAIAAAVPDAITYDLEPFAELVTAGPQDVIITRGEAFSVRGEGSDGVLGRFVVEVENGRLEIRPKENFEEEWRRLSAATFRITVPALEEIALAGSGNVRADRIEGPRFTGTIAGSGQLEIGSLVVETLDFTIAGSGDVALAGAARAASISIGGSGDVQAKGLRSRSAEIHIAGAGDVELAVEDEARIAILGSGDVDISGSATCSVTRIGRGDVSCNGRKVAD